MFLDADLQTMISLIIQWSSIVHLSTPIAFCVALCAQGSFKISLGAYKSRARAFAKKLNDAPLAIIDKRRSAHNVSEVMHLIGDVRGKVRTHRKGFERRVSLCVTCREPGVGKVFCVSRAWEPSVVLFDGMQRPCAYPGTCAARCVACLKG